MDTILDNMFVYPHGAVLKAEVKPCSCGRLVAPLGSDEDIRDIDHLCDATAAASCTAWLKESLGGRPGDSPMVVALDYFNYVTVYEDDAFRAELVDSDGAELHVAIRQWVEEPDTDAARTFRIGLSRDPLWKYLLADVDQAIRHPMRQPLKPGHAQSAEDAFLMCNPLTIQWQQLSVALMTLAHYGLPATPSTARYVLECLALSEGETAKSCPRRGVLVRSFGIVRPIHKKPYGDTLISSIVSTPPWVSKELLNEARETMNRHLDWWRGRSRNVLDINTRGGSISVELEADIAAHLSGQLTVEDVLEKERERYEKVHGSRPRGDDDKLLEKRVRMNVKRRKEINL